MQYITVIRIISQGEDNFDAGDKAGSLINLSKLKNDMLIESEPTKLLEADQKS